MCTARCLNAFFLSRDDSTDLRQRLNKLDAGCFLLEILMTEIQVYGGAHEQKPARKVEPKWFGFVKLKQVGANIL